MWTPRLACATMLMKMNGRSKSCPIVARASSISARLLSLWHLLTSWLPEAVLRPKKMLDYTWPSEMKSLIRARWMRVETHTLLQCAVETSMSSVVSVASSVWTLSKSMRSNKTNGPKWLSWKTSVIIWAHAQSMMNSYTLSVASLAAQSRRSTIRLRCTMLTKILGLSSLCVWKTLSGPARPWLYHPPRSFWSEERTRTETVKCTFSMFKARLGARSTRWTSFEYHTSPSSSRIKYMW